MLTLPSSDLVGGIDAMPSSASNSSALFNVDFMDTTPSVPSTGENDLPAPSLLLKLKRGAVSVVMMMSSCLDSTPSSSNRKPPKNTLHFEGACCFKNSAYANSRDTPMSVVLGKTDAASASPRRTSATFI